MGTGQRYINMFLTTNVKISLKEEILVVYIHILPFEQLRTQVDARRTAEGTYPPGSMWTANPILPYQVIQA